MAFCCVSWLRRCRKNLGKTVENCHHLARYFLLSLLSVYLSTTQQRHHVKSLYNRLTSKIIVKILSGSAVTKIYKEFIKKNGKYQWYLMSLQFLAFEFQIRKSHAFLISIHILYLQLQGNLKHRQNTDLLAKWHQHFYRHC